MELGVWISLSAYFLLMIGMTLIAEGFGAHVPKGYIYAAMAFSVLVEALNMLVRRKRQPEKQVGTPAITQRAKDELAG